MFSCHDSVSNKTSLVDVLIDILLVQHNQASWAASKTLIVNRIAIADCSAVHSVLSPSSVAYLSTIKAMDSDRAMPSAQFLSVSGCTKAER
jgi:hypothetical protein